MYFYGVKAPPFLIKMDMEYFSIEELCESSAARKSGIINMPTPQAKTNLIRLVNNVLDPAREALGKPIHVNSGYRCERLNREVGGAKNSQHVKGEAADIELGDKTVEENKRLFEWIRDNCEFDQLINEQYYSWIHVSYREGNNRKEVLSL